MIIMDRDYIVPLRKEWLKAPHYKRAKKAVTAVKQFLTKHMKATEVKVGKYMNKEIWKRGIKNPPHHIKVNASKDAEGVVAAEIEGAPVEKAPEEKKEEKKPEAPTAPKPGPEPAKAEPEKAPVEPEKAEPLKVETKETPKTER